MVIVKVKNSTQHRKLQVLSPPENKISEIFPVFVATLKSCSYIIHSLKLPRSAAADLYLTEQKMIPFSHYFEFSGFPEAAYPGIINEFKDNGSTSLVLTDKMLTGFLKEPWGFTKIKRLSVQYGFSFGDAHLPFGQPYDLCCSEKGRRAGMLADQKQAMAYAADAGCRTCTVHMGAYESVAYKTPNSELRPRVVDALGILLEEAEKLDIVLAIENSFERSNTPAEVLYYMSCFDTPYLGVCYDSGHACLMSDFPGKVREKYFASMDNAWGETVECYPDALGDLLPHIVTCHLHDNDGYSDAHRMPGEGRIVWDELLGKLRTAPRLMTMQSEVSMMRYGYSIRRLTECFDRLLK